MDFFSQGGGPPTGPDAVIKYYDDLLKGQYGGKKYSPTSLIIVLFIPLITSFSIIWALVRILPVFKQRENRPAAAVLAMGLSIYVVPTMSWMIMQVFPPILGVSAILIGVAMLLMAIFIIVSTAYQFGDLKWGTGTRDYDHDDDRDSIFDDILHPDRNRRDRDRRRDEEPINVGEMEANDRSIVDMIEKINNDIKGIPNDENWRVLFSKDVDLSQISEQDFERRRIYCIQYLEVVGQKIKDFKSKLKSIWPWSRFRSIPKEERIKLLLKLSPIEDNINKLLAELKGHKKGEWMGVRGRIISFINNIIGSGKDFRESWLGWFAQAPTPKQLEEERQVRVRKRRKTAGEETKKDIEKDEEIKKLRESFGLGIEGIKRIASDSKNYMIPSPSDIDKQPVLVKSSLADVAIALKGIVDTANEIEEALRKNLSFENLWKDYFAAKLNPKFKTSIANFENKIVVFDTALKYYYDFCNKTSQSKDPDNQHILEKLDNWLTDYLKKFDNIRDIRDQIYIPAEQQAKKRWP